MTKPTTAPAAKIELTAKRTDLWRFDPNAVVIIGVDTDHKAGEHPYRETDERMNVEIPREFIDSVKSKGVQVPVGIRRTADKKLEVAFGRRRSMANRIANAELLAEGKEPKLLPAIIVKDTDDREAVETMILENELRLDDTPLAKAKKLEIALAFGHTDASAAAAFGVSITAVRNWKKLLDLAPEIKDKVEMGEISSSAAMDLAVLPKEEQVTRFEELKAEAPEGKPVTVKQTTRTRRKATKSSAETPFKVPTRKVVHDLVKNVETSGLPEDAIAMLKWLTGHAEPKDVFGLEEALKELDKAKAFKVSDAQQDIIDDLIKNGPKAESEVNKKTMAALAKKGVVEGHTGADGVVVVRLTEAYCNAAGIEPQA